MKIVKDADNCFFKKDDNGKYELLYKKSTEGYDFGDFYVSNLRDYLRSLKDVPYRDNAALYYAFNDFSLMNNSGVSPIVIDFKKKNPDATRAEIQDYFAKRILEVRKDIKVDA